MADNLPLSTVLLTIKAKKHQTFSSYNKRKNSSGLIKTLLLQISKNSQKNNCAGVFFLIKLKP